MENLMHYINALWYAEGCVDADIKLYCWTSGHWSWEDTVDFDGNIIDSVRAITRANLQSACDELGLDVDCFSW